MSVKTIRGMVIETEPDEEEVVAVAIETDTDTYLVAPEEVAEELMDLMGRRVEVTGTIVEQEDHLPIIEVESYTEILDDLGNALEEEEEEADGEPGEEFVEDDEHLG